MYLKSVSVKGFKSFPDRTRLEFGPGVSVIVGPNGSGKSNVTDAVLWALGEQSPVAVRGQSMQDVIFGGAPGRKAASAAEVELVLDDSEQSLGLGISEISIVRRLDRSGEGEYRLAGARCRLIDVLELMSDTGLGKEMHSVISQGRVESLVTSKPRERRLLIEEAAGLGKHRKRRRRAQLKLERTHDNLDRALDVEREARSRLRPLKRQAEAAELHERLERQTFEIRWELVRDALRARGVECEAAQAQTERVRAERSQLEAELKTVGARRQQAEEVLRARSAQREELSNRTHAARGARERIEYRTESIDATRARVAQRLEQSRRVLETLQAELAADHEDPEAAARIEALEHELEALQRDRQAELARQLAVLESELEAAGERIAESERAVAAALERDATATAAPRRPGARSARPNGARELARREAARVGGELAAVNQFLRNHAGAIHGATSLSDSLDVAPGYELAVAAALDGRLAAAVVDGTDAGWRAARPRRQRRRSGARRRIRHGRRRTRDPAVGRRRAAAGARPRRRGDARDRRAAAGRHVGPRQPRRLPGRVHRRRGDPRRARLERPRPGASPGAGGRRGPRARPAKPPPAAGRRVRARRPGRARRPRRGRPRRRRRPRPPTPSASGSSPRTAPRSGRTTRRSRSAAAWRRRSTAGGRRPTRAPAPTGARS